MQSVVAAPDPNQAQAVKIGAFSGWLQEEVNSDIFPYANRRTLFVEAYANRYALSLACVPPGEADAAETAVYIEMCDQIWQQMMFGFSVKPIGIAAECPEVTVPPDHITWRRVSSNWYRYSFDIPAHWLEQRSVTSDRLGFLDDPAIYDQPNSCPLPNGIMAVDFSVDPPGNFGTGEPNSVPDTAGYAETTIAERTAWIQTVHGGELMGPADVGTTVYIKGNDYWYHFWLLCVPPTDAGAAEQDAFKAQCADTLSQILASFEIR